MALLDNLFSGNTNDPADDQWKRAALEELLARVSRTAAPNNDPAENPLHGAVSFAPSRSRGDIPRPMLIDQPAAGDPSPPPSPSTVPMVPPLAGTGPMDDAASPWKPPMPAMGARDVAAPAPYGEPYAPPATTTGWGATPTPAPTAPPTPAATATTAPGTLGGGTSDRTPSFYDRLGAFANSNSLLGGIAAAGNLDRNFEDRNATMRALADKLGDDPAIARAIATDPDAFKAALPLLFAKPKAPELQDGFDDQGRKTKMMWNPTTKKWERVGGSSAPEANAYSTQRGKDQAEQYSTIVKAAGLARDQLVGLDSVDKALSTYNDTSVFGTGRAAPVEAAMRGYLRHIGVGNADTIASAELISAFQNKMALVMRNPDSGMGMPGAVSDADRRFLQDAQPGIDKSPEGNRKLLEISRKLEQRKIELASFTEQYAREHNGLEGFDGAVRKWAEQNPIFVGGPARAPTPAGAPASAPGATTRLRFDPSTGTIGSR